MVVYGIVIGVGRSFSNIVWSEGGILEIVIRFYRLCGGEVVMEFFDDVIRDLKDDVFYKVVESVLI